MPARQHCPKREELKIQLMLPSIVEARLAESWHTGNGSSRLHNRLGMSQNLNLGMAAFSGCP